MKYQASKNNRINYGFIGITTFDKNHWMFHENQNKWINHSDFTYISDGKGCCSHQRCKSVKAFKRKLKKCPKYIKFILVSKWIGYNVIGYNTAKNIKTI